MNGTVVHAVLHDTTLTDIIHDATRSGVVISIGIVRTADDIAAYVVGSDATHIVVTRQRAG